MTHQPFLAGYLPYLLQRADQLMSRRFHGDLQAAGIGVSEWRVARGPPRRR